MKKLCFKYFVGVLFTAATINSNAQNWNLGGNNAPPLNGANNIFGTNDNFAIRVVTNGTLRMHINNGAGINAGYIGIGTSFTNPQTPLHVQGSGTFSSLGWTRGISISNSGTLAFLPNPGANSIFFMGLAK